MSSLEWGVLVLNLLTIWGGSVGTAYHMGWCEGNDAGRWR